MIDNHGRSLRPDPALDDKQWDLSKIVFSYSKCKFRHETVFNIKLSGNQLAEILDHSLRGPEGGELEDWRHAVAPTPGGSAPVQTTQSYFFQNYFHPQKVQGLLAVL